MKRKSILDIKTSPLPKVAMFWHEGKVRTCILFPGAVEALIFDRPTPIGADNETIHQCRKRGYQGYRDWPELTDGNPNAIPEDEDFGLEPPVYPKCD